MKRIKINKDILKKDAKKYTLIAIGGIIVIILLFIVFRDLVGKEPVPEENSALVTEIPDAEEGALHDDKRKAYEENDMIVDVSKGAQSLDELFPAIETESQQGASDIITDTKNESSPIQKRNANYYDTQNELLDNVDNFNQTTLGVVPADTIPVQTTLNDDEIIRLKQEEARTQAMKEFEMMMQKYSPQQQEAEKEQKDYLESERSQNTIVQPIITDQTSVVSTIGGHRRQGGFFGTTEIPDQKNTIKASVYGKHLIQSGQFIRLRLDEPMQVGKSVLSPGSIVIGRASVGEDRLFVTINSIEYNGIIYLVNLDVFDTDGMLGMHLPGSMEVEAAREIGTDVASALGSSTTNSAMFQTQPSATEQLKTDVGRGLIQGTFRYVGRKLQVIKVTVQDKHKVYLLPKN